MSRVERYVIQPAFRNSLKSGWRSLLTSTAEFATPSGKLPAGGRTKRVMDLIIASLALVVAAPIMLAAAVLIYLRMGRPIIFAHDRVGFGGKMFRCFKFRTMVTDAQQRLEEYLTSNPEARQMWEQQQKLKADPRVTSLGRLLRQSSIDELPQLFNILRGDMSCVGPRPVTPIELQERYGRRARYYNRVRPGLTGLWQVSGRSSLSYRSRVALDCAYVRRCSPLLDLMILVKTLPAVMRFKDSA